MQNSVKDHFTRHYDNFYRRFLPSLKPDKGNECLALCPFHEDRNPSFSINKQNGKYYCYGCKDGGDIFTFYGRQKGLDPGKDFPKIVADICKDFGINNGNGNKQTGKPTVVARYDYLDEAEKLTYQIERLQPKNFRIRRPDGKGGWIYKKEEVHIVPYHLPEILKATEIIIVEGEKDADNLITLGFTATTNPFGAGSWPDHFGQYLKGKAVVLLPDNDDQGREHMRKVAANLKVHATSIKWLDLPDLPGKGDVSDFIASFPSKEEAAERLAVMIESAAEWQPSKTKTFDDGIFEISDFATITVPERQNIIAPWQKEQGITLISGSRGVGKSMFGMSIADSITKKTSFGPWTVEASVPVCYVDGEMPVSDTKERFDSFANDLKRRNPLHIYSDHYASVLGLPRANLLSEEWQKNIKSFLLTRGIKLWILDNLASLTPGIDENIKKDWDPINQFLLDLRFAGIATIMMHHTGKDGSQRGTSAREDNIDTSIILKHPLNYVKEDGCKFVLSFSKARVPHRDLGAVADFQFQLNQDESGKCTWTWGNVRRERKFEILKMLNDGNDYDTICAALDITKGYVSKIKTVATSDGHLDSKGRLTATGWSLIKGENW